MVEIDHSILHPPEPEPGPEPEPAIPILASHLLQLEQKQRTRFTRDGRTERLSTHCEEIDEMLGGGIERGIVMGISSEGIEGRLMSLQLLASVLLSQLPLSLKPGQTPKTKATIIDTTGSFPLQLLARVLKSRLTSSHALSTRTAIQTANYPVSRSTQSKDRSDEELIEKELQQCLEMIAITRVFDIEGLWEVLGEIGHEPSTTSQSNSLIPITHPEQSETGNKTDRPIQSSPDWPSPEVEGEAETEINDSQETPSPSPPQDRINNEHTRPEEPREEDEGIEIIIIDAMTQIINELFSHKERNDAHTFLTLLSRQIHTLSTTNNILTILHNTTTASKPSFTPYPYPYPYPQPPPHQNPNQPPRPQPPKQTQKKSNPQPTSLFAPNPSKPSLGSLFSQFPSLHLFCSPLPRTRSDAEVLYSGSVSGSGSLYPESNSTSTTTSTSTPGGGVRYCSVIEVLMDECPYLPEAEAKTKTKTKEEGERERQERKKIAYREQRWCAVELDASRTGLKSTFEMRGGMKGMGMGMERTGIGHGIPSEIGIGTGPGTSSDITKQKCQEKGQD